MNRLQGVHEATSEIQSYQPKTSTREQSTPNQKKSNSCIVTVAPDRWKGEYFNNDNLQGSPSMIRDDGNGFIDADWGNKGPCNWKDNFSVRWTRTVSFDDGTYRFMVTGDDGIRLYIDDQLKLSKWLDQEATTYTTNVELPAGKHTISLEYYENVGGAIAKLSWQKVSTPEQPTTQSPVSYNLTGDWEGKVYDEKATLKITQNGNNLSGNIVFGDVEEYLSGEVNNDRIVLKGTGYKLKKDINFSLDTFQGMVGKNGNSINGNCTDEDGHGGKWFVKRKSKMLTQESIPDQNKNQDNYKPDMTNHAPQAKLTKKMRKTPCFQIEHAREGCSDKIHYTVDDAKICFLDNDSLEIHLKADRVTINCTWSSSDNAYVGTWRRDIGESDHVSNGKIKLFPQFNSNNEIKSFYGYIMSYSRYIRLIGTWSYGNDYPGTPISIVPSPIPFF